MGAGGVGGYFGARLQQKTDSSLFYVARGEHLEAMQRKGLEIKSVDGDFRLDVRAERRPEEGKRPDLVLFTVKSYDTDEAIEEIKPVVKSDTIVLSLQNGIENYEKLKSTFGDERALEGLCRVGAGIETPGVIRHYGLGSVIVGENNGRYSERTKIICDLFSRAGIECRISENIRRDVWLKFTWNSIFNMLTAAENVTVDKLFESEETRNKLYELFDEISLIAEKKGTDLNREDGEKLIEKSKRLDGFVTSTLRDRRKGKKLEYEAFTGAILRIADEYDLDLPQNRELYEKLEKVSFRETNQ